jgi:hypothetical protein
MPSGSLPPALESPFGVGEANPSIELTSGAARLWRGRQSIDLSDARVFVSAQPSWGLRFEGTGQSTETVIMNQAINGWTPSRVSLPSLGAAGDTYNETVQFGGDFTELPYAITARGELRQMRSGRARKLERVLFHVTNFPYFIGSPIGDTTGRWMGRLELSGGAWHIVLDARRELRSIQEALREEGGFAVTHVAALDKGGATFTWKEAKECLDGLHWYLSFVRGAWTSPILVQGRPKRGSATLNIWSVARTDAWGGQFRWCDQANWAATQEAYRGYTTLWADPVWQQSLRVGIGQYITANKPNPVENAIIAAQSGLELLGWLQFVEARNVSAADWNDPRLYPAHKKIRELLGLASVNADIPVRFASLMGLDPSWRDGPSVVAGVRNRLVHPKNVAGRVGWPTPVLIDTWLLSTHYLELSLLYAMGVQSLIRDRLGRERGVGATLKPPWAP